MALPSHFKKSLKSKFTFCFFTITHLSPTITSLTTQTILIRLFSSTQWTAHKHTWRENDWKINIEGKLVSGVRWTWRKTRWESKLEKRKRDRWEWQKTDWTAAAEEEVEVEAVLGEKLREILQNDLSNFCILCFIYAFKFFLKSLHLTLNFLLSVLEIHLYFSRTTFALDAVAVLELFIKREAVWCRNKSLFMAFIKYRLEFPFKLMHRINFLLHWSIGAAEKVCPCMASIYEKIQRVTLTIKY